MKFLYFSLYTLLFLCFSCKTEFFIEQDTTIKFPSSSSFLENGLKLEFSEWKVFVFTEEKMDTFYLKQNEFSFCFKKNRPSCVLAFPLCKNSSGKIVDFFKPCGALLWKENNGELELTWEQGFASYIMACLFKSFYVSSTSKVLRRFNWPRLCEEIIKLCESNDEYFYNPWLLDLETVVSSIAYDSFKISLLKLKDVSSASIPNSAGIIYSSYVPEQKSFNQKRKLTIKDKEVNLFMDNYSNGLLLKRDEENNVLIKYTALPILNIEHD